MNIAAARSIADGLVFLLAPYCERVEIAGSIRRGKDDVGDIEIVCVSKIAKELDMFGVPVRTRPSIDYPLEQLKRDGARTLLSGPRQKQYALPQGINLDLFIVVPPAQWGVIFTIRTGPKEFGQWCVTSRTKGGAMPNEYQCSDGHITHKVLGSSVPLPEERDFLAFLGLGWIEPADRKPMWWSRKR